MFVFCFVKFYKHWNTFKWANLLGTNYKVLEISDGRVFLILIWGSGKLGRLNMQNICHKNNQLCSL